MDWTYPFVDPNYTKPPGNINPPPPDEIKPSDPGWNDWANKELKNCPLKWGPDCKMGIVITLVTKGEERPVDGDNPDDYSKDKNWGWKPDEEQKTTPPAEYKDFVRWKRHYPKIRTQKFDLYEVQLKVNCDGKDWTSFSDSFWFPEGPPQETGPRDVYTWTVTSGVRRDDKGNVFEWKKVDKEPPIWEQPYPSPLHLESSETPPAYMLTSYEDLRELFKIRLDLKYDLKSLYWAWPEPKLPRVRILWERIGDVIEGAKRKPRKG